jgi:hypothetical protein
MKTPVMNLYTVDNRTEKFLFQVFPERKALPIKFRYPVKAAALAFLTTAVYQRRAGHLVFSANDFGK